MRKTDGVQLGFYHADPARFPEHFQEAIKKPYVSCFMCEPSFSEADMNPLARIQEVGGKAWISVGGLTLDIRNDSAMVDVNDGDEKPFCPVASFKPNWQQNLQNMVDRIKADGMWDTFLGMYMDEPLLWNITGEMLCELTGYFRELCPEKGVFICFSVAGVAPEFWTINDIKPINPDTGRYITDVAFDMYHPFDESYKQITDMMVNRLGNRSDIKYWFVPCVMNYRGDKDEAHCINHTNGCMDLLKQFPVNQRGGLMCYTWHTFPAEEEALGNIGLDILLNPDSGMYWPNLGKYLDELGESIMAGELDQ